MFKLPLSLPLCVGWGCFLRFWGRDLPAFMSLKRYVSRGLWRDPPARSHFKRFGLKIVLSLRFGVHVFSWPRFLSTGSALGAHGSKSLHYYSTFRVHTSETTIKTDSKLELCTPRGTFELLAAVLYCFQNLMQNPSENQNCGAKAVYFAHGLDS